MRHRSPQALARVLAFIALACLAGPRPARADGGETQVTYVDGAGGIYLDRGASAGLTQGLEGTIVRRGEAIGAVVLTTVTDGRASGRVTRSDRPLRPGDVLVYTPAPVPARATPTRRIAPLETLDGDARAAAWRAALTAEARPLVAFEGGAAARVQRIRARAETEFTARAYSGAPDLSYNDQRVSLYARGQNVGASGLSLGLRGDVSLRYGGAPRAYETGEVAVIQLRELAVRYAAGERILASAGRFKPDARIAGLLDGGQVAWGGDHLSFSAFGGLRPSMTDLAPRADVPAFGLSAAWASGRAGPRDARVAVAWLSELGDTGRHHLSLDTSLASHGRWVREQATLRASPGGGPSGVSFASLKAHTPLGGSRALDASARYLDPHLYGDDLSPQTLAWADPLDRQALARADLGLTLPAGERARLRPYAFYHQALITGQDDVLVAAGGLSFRRDKVFDSTFAVDLHADYGDGTRQQARIGVDTVGALGGHLTTQLGLSSQWTYGHDHGLHTFQHLAHAGLTYSGDLPLQLWLGLYGGLDHSLYVGRALGGWGAGQLGLAWAF